MHSYLHNYVKRDEWLQNGINFGTYLRELEEFRKIGIPRKKAKKIAKRTLWKLIKLF